MSKLKRIALMALLLVVLIVIAFPQLIFVDTITSKVTDKNIKRYDDKDKYMIYTVNEDTGKAYVFEDTDCLIPFKINSSDIYAKIYVGETYEFEVRGLRIPLTSSYQNIFDVK